MFKPELLDQIYREFNILLTVGNIFPFLHTKGWMTLAILNYFLAYSIIGLGMVLLAYTCFLVKGHPSFLSQVSESQKDVTDMVETSGPGAPSACSCCEIISGRAVMALHMLGIGAVSMAASVSISFKRKNAAEFEELFLAPEGFVSYAQSEYFKGLKRECFRSKRRNIVLWVAMYGTCGLIGASQGLIDKVAGTTLKVVNINGAWINLPFIVWSPFDLENGRMLWLATYIFQSFYLLYCAIQVVAAVVICFDVSNKIMSHLKLQLWALENMDLRAQQMFYSVYGHRRIKEMQKEYNQCYYDCIIENVMHHIRTKVEFEKLLAIARIAIAVPFYGGAILLGTALITVTADDDPRLGTKILALALASSEFLNMYNLCKLGQDFQDVSDQIFDKLFYTKWYTKPIKCSRAIIIMRSGCSRPLKLEVLLLTLSMGLFADLVNSAYSIFNLRAVSQD